MLDALPRCSQRRRKTANIGESELGRSAPVRGQWNKRLDASRDRQQRQLASFSDAVSGMICENNRPDQGWWKLYPTAPQCFLPA